MSDSPTSLVLSVDELRQLTGGYRRVADQLRELHARGFARARVVNGSLILERAHYEAVCAGRVEPSRPKVRAPVVRSSAAA